MCAVGVAGLQGASGNHPFHPVRGGLLVWDRMGRASGTSDV